MSSRGYGLPTRTNPFKLSRVSAHDRDRFNLDAPLTIGERNVWFALDGVTPISTREADKLLGSELARRVALTHFATGYSVSTVFLVADAYPFGDGPPVLWETAVFDPDGGVVDMTRYVTRSEAERGHDAAVANLRVMVAELGAVLDGVVTE